MPVAPFAIRRVGARKTSGADARRQMGPTAAELSWLSIAVVERIAPRRPA